MKITVYGTPGPQGSKRFVGLAKSGRGIMIESSAKVKPWREAVKCAAMQVAHSGGVMGTIRGPVRVTMVFTLKRPKSAKRGAVPSKKPDLSKLVRSTEDALTDAGIWEDDARVVHLTAMKCYEPSPLTRGVRLTDAWEAAALERPGCIITIEAM